MTSPENAGKNAVRAEPKFEKHMRSAVQEKMNERGAEPAATNVPKQRAPIPRVTAELLVTDQGLPALDRAIRSKIAGRNRNASVGVRLAALLDVYENWATDILPSLTFAQVLSKAQQIGGNKTVRSFLTQRRHALQTRHNRHGKRGRSRTLRCDEVKASDETDRESLRAQRRVHTLDDTSQPTSPIDAEHFECGENDEDENTREPQVVEGHRVGGGASQTFNDDIPAEAFGIELQVSASNQATAPHYPAHSDDADGYASDEGAAYLDDF